MKIIDIDEKGFVEFQVTDERIYRVPVNEMKKFVLDFNAAIDNRLFGKIMSHIFNG